MTSQFDFSAEQWEHIATTPVLVGYAVAKAEDSGYFGTIRETRTLVASIAAGVENSPAKSLVEQAAATETEDKAHAFRSVGAQELAEAAVNACRDLSEMLSGTARPEEADGYKQWVLSIAHTVAEAAKEHGVRTSPAEAALIQRIDAALTR